ncbi:MAG: efflux RND transporter periplasmic adaptor subunit, partial [Phycisphaerales bacterium]
MSSSNEEMWVGQVRRLLFRWALVVVALVAVLVWATWRLGRASARLPGESATLREVSGAPSQGRAWYRCTMAECNDVGSSDPDSRCPVCGMKRERVDAGPGESASGSPEISLSERAQRLAALATEPVTRRRLFKRIRTVGRVAFDETRHKMVSAWTSGRIDRLFADFTGMVVSKGDHLVEIYSPELLSAQEELLQALRVSAAMDSGGRGPIGASGEQLMASAERKLELLGITASQIEELKRTGRAATHLVIYAPLGGTIVHKAVVEGMYVHTGDMLYEIADLTHVWLMLELYEEDLPWVRPFEEVRVTATSLPGEEFRGRIVFVDPVVDRVTRTIKVRVDVENPQLRLKPDMYVTGEIDVAMGKGAGAATRRPPGDFVCPMHTWELADIKGLCPICEMDMVPVESIPGFLPPVEAVASTAVPREAVMQTGARSLAYVEVSPGMYRGVEIRVGPLAQDETGRQFYPVLAGLEEGQHVVTRGNFVIDSQMQIAGKPSLFDARGLGIGAGAGHHAYHGMGAAAPSEEGRGQAEEHEGHKAAPAQGVMTGQEVCPVMGNAIDPTVFTDYRGVRIYFCCPPCRPRFIAEPHRYIPNLPEEIQRRLASAQPAGEGLHHD